MTADISRRALVRTLAAAGVASAVGIPRAAHAIVPGGGRRSGAGELLIRGGRVVNADGVVTADVRIVGERVEIPDVEALRKLVQLLGTKDELVGDPGAR